MHLIEKIEESINLELNMSSLYTIFYDLFPEDHEFWWRLVLEEKNHAALFRSGLDSIEQTNRFPHDLLISNIDALKNKNKYILNLIMHYKSSPPSREEAFNIALILESTDALLHYENFMMRNSDILIDKIYQQLNKADKNHAARIYKYMKDADIDVDIGVEHVVEKNIGHIKTRIMSLEPSMGIDSILPNENTMHL